MSLFRDLPLSLVQDDKFEVELVVSRSTYRQYEVSLQQHFEGSSVKVTAVGIPFGKPVKGRLSKTLTMINYGIAAGLHALFRHSDLKVFLTQPPFFSALGLLRKKFFQKPYICILMDLYPEVLTANGWLNKSGRLNLALERLAFSIHSNASALVVIGRDTQDYLSGQQIPKDKFRYIPNWASREPEEPLSRQKNRLRSEMGFSNSDFIVLYSGNQGVAHHFDDILPVARKMPEVKFVFIGNGPRHREIVDFKQRSSLTNIHIFDYQPVDKLIESLSIGDVHFMSLKKGFDSMAVPSKFFGALSVGRPVIFQGSDNCELAKIISEHNCGAQVPIGTSDELQQVIQNYISDPNQLSLDSEAAFQAYQRNFSSSVGVSRYKQTISQVLSSC